MKILNLEDILTKSKKSKAKERIFNERYDSRSGTHFICKKLGRNVTQYWCDEVCKLCKINNVNNE